VVWSMPITTGTRRSSPFRPDARDPHPCVQTGNTAPPPHGRATRSCRCSRPGPRTIRRPSAISPTKVRAATILVGYRAEERRLHRHAAADQPRPTRRRHRRTRGPSLLKTTPQPHETSALPLEDQRRRHRALVILHIEHGRATRQTTVTEPFSTWPGRHCPAGVNGPDGSGPRPG
jgi:hypothetical protein